MKQPLISVVCLCFNHSRFVEEAVASVTGQTYPNIELIIVDDHSSDDSVSVIKKIAARRPDIAFIPLPSNHGNCSAFNIGLRGAKGEFIIDLSADDVLVPERVAKGVRLFQESGPKTGVVFSDAELIDEAGKHLGFHSDRFPHASIPQGDIYKELLERYFINSPTMMVRKRVLDDLSGYDEQLAYEDFDFWVRSSRNYTYHYSPEPLVKRRVLSSSMGKSQYNRASGHMRSTFAVCQKALSLNRNKEEHAALRKRIGYEVRKAFLAGDLRLVWDYLKLRTRIP